MRTIRAIVAGGLFATSGLAAAQGWVLKCPGNLYQNTMDADQATKFIRAGCKLLEGTAPPATSYDGNTRYS